MFKHATASAFVFGRFDRGWRLGLIDHPRLRHKMNPGGHVEHNETQGQAVLREVTEESGLSVRLIDPPVAPLPPGYPYSRVAQPWWINEMFVPPDSHLVEPHIHIDHQYVAIADEPLARSGGAEHEFHWYGRDELAGLLLFDDTRLLADFLFPLIEELNDK